MSKQSKKSTKAKSPPPAKGIDWAELIAQGRDLILESERNPPIPEEDLDDEDDDDREFMQAQKTVDPRMREYLAKVVPNGAEANELCDYFLKFKAEGVHGYNYCCIADEGPSDRRRAFHMVVIAFWEFTDKLEKMCADFEDGAIDDAWLLEQAIDVYRARGVLTVEDFEDNEYERGLYMLATSDPKTVLRKFARRKKGAK